MSVPILGCMSFGSDRWLDWVINEAEARTHHLQCYLSAHINTGTTIIEDRLGPWHQHLRYR